MKSETLAEFSSVVDQVEVVDYEKRTLGERSFSEAFGKVIDSISSSSWVAITAALVLGSYFAPAIIARWKNLVHGWRISNRAAAVIQAGLDGETIRDETIEVALKVLKVKIDRRTDFSSGNHELCEIYGGHHSTRPKLHYADG